MSPNSLHGTSVENVIASSSSTTLVLPIEPVPAPIAHSTASSSSFTALPTPWATWSPIAAAAAASPRTITAVIIGKDLVKVDRLVQVHWATNGRLLDQRHDLLNGRDAGLCTAQDLDDTVRALGGHVREYLDARSDFL